MSDFLARIGSIWILLLLAVVLIVVFLLIILSSVVRKGKAAEEAREAAAAPPDQAAPPAAEGQDTASARVEEPSTSFARAMRFLRTMVGGRNYRYQLPWFLLMGEPGSGKSCLMTEAGVDVAGATDDASSGSRRALEWRFLDEGVLIAASGQYLRGPSRSAFDWGKLLRLLQNNRPRRPLDGIVLTIAASDLAGPNALDETELSARASRMADMLSQAQKVLGFAFPVYTIVTKCDQVPGFSGFCQELPGRTNEDIFGWSSPYHLEASFTAEWVDQGFEQIASDLQRLQSEIFVERTQLSDADSVFLFPDEFARLRTPLRSYLDRLFRQSAYRESFRFCGIYFTGEISRPVAPPPEPPAPQEDLPPELLAEIPPSDAEVSAVRQRCRPSYVRQIFDLKIIPQAGVARPLSNVYMARSRSVLAIQWTAAIIALVLGLGTYFAYRRMSRDASAVANMLHEMQRMPQTPENQRYNLLLAMAPAGSASLYSVFLPASKFSALDGNLTEVMRIACENWVLETLRAGLEHRANDLLKTTASSGAATDEASAEQSGGDQEAVSDPERVPEYKQLDAFVTDLNSLQDYRGIYEGLRVHNIGNSDQMRRLVSYLYGVKLAEYEPNGHLGDALAKANGPALEISADQQDRASERMTRLATHIFERWFGDNILLSDVEQAKEQLGSLERGQIINHDQLKTLLDTLQQLDNDLRDPDFRWVASPRLDLTGRFRRVVYDPIAVRKNPYLRPETLESLRSFGEDALGKLRETLTAERTPMSGLLLEMKDSATLSKGARELQVALQNALNLPFMVPIGSRAIAITLDPKSRMIWKPDPLREALRLMDVYQRFVKESLRDAPAGVQPILARVAQDQMRRHVQNLIAESQDVKRRNEATADLGSEDDVLAEANNFKEVTDPKAPLLEMANRFGQLNLMDMRNSIMRILVLQSYNLLSVIDDRLSGADTYAARGGKFGWWDGKGQTSLEAYQVRDATELAEYLNTQRDRIKYLVQQGQPLVDFLNTWLPTRGESQNRLITKWQRLGANFKQYDGKKPGATLGALENFILTRMDKVTPDNGCKDADPDAERGGLNQDYFHVIHATMRTDLIERCRQISAEGVYAAYTQMADLFNRTLAGRFPFGPVPDKANPEAAVDAVSEFYAVYDRNNKTARGTLREDRRFGEAAVHALDFLDQMEKLRPLVVPASPDAEKEPPFTVDFVPHFRANQPNERGGNQIIDWTLQVAGQIFRQREPDHPGRWRPGNTVRFSLRWANDSMFLPAADGQPDLRLRDRNAYFELTNRWSLLEFIRRHQAAPSEIRQADAQTYVLKFALKMEQDPKWVHQADDPAPGNTAVFMAVRLSMPGSKAALTLPPFPVTAPRLTSPGGAEGSK
jgi:type VI secretion system protein ImpL